MTKSHLKAQKILELHIQREMVLFLYLTNFLILLDEAVAGL